MNALLALITVGFSATQVQYRESPPLLKANDYWEYNTVATSGDLDGRIQPSVSRSKAYWTITECKREGDFNILTLRMMVGSTKRYVTLAQEISNHELSRMEQDGTLRRILPSKLPISGSKYDDGAFDGGKENWMPASGRATIEIEDKAYGRVTSVATCRFGHQVGKVAEEVYLNPAVVFRVYSKSRGEDDPAYAEVISVLTASNYLR